MRSPIPAMRSILIADDELMTLLGGPYNGVPKVFFNAAPQGVSSPYIMLYEVSGAALGELLTEQRGPWEKRVSLDARAESYGKATGIGDRAIALLNNLRGPADDIVIQDCRIVSDVPLYEEEAKIARRITDFRVIYA